MPHNPYHVTRQHVLSEMRACFSRRPCCRNCTLSPKACLLHYSSTCTLHSCLFPFFEFTLPPCLLPCLSLPFVYKFRGPELASSLLSKRPSCVLCVGRAGHTQPAPQAQDPPDGKEELEHVRVHHRDFRTSKRNLFSQHDSKSSLSFLGSSSNHAISLEART